MYYVIIIQLSIQHSAIKIKYIQKVIYSTNIYSVIFSHIFYKLLIYKCNHIHDSMIK